MQRDTIAAAAGRRWKSGGRGEHCRHCEEQTEKRGGVSGVSHLMPLAAALLRACCCVVLCVPLRLRCGVGRVRRRPRRVLFKSRLQIRPATTTNAARQCTRQRVERKSGTPQHNNTHTTVLRRTRTRAEGRAAAEAADQRHHRASSARLSRDRNDTCSALHRAACAPNDQSIGSMSGAIGPAAAARLAVGPASTHRICIWRFH